LFRQTLPSDVPALFEVRARTRENGMSPQQLLEIGITPESVAADIASGKVTSWICLDESKPVGFCNGDVETGEVLVLAVLADYEGKGIGKRLLAAVVEALRSAGCDKIWLAASSNPAVRSHGFYRYLGWRPTGQHTANGEEILRLG
jgi:ribosomal protein S18 acetylase RimI-like enzyme